jgi:hypothetical protein
MPSSEVGTGTQRTPRSQLAATNPARSVTAPPPTPINTSVRVKPAAPSSSQQRAATSIDLASSASGTSTAVARMPAFSIAAATTPARAASGAANRTAARTAPSISVGRTGTRSRPMSTS